MTVAAKRLVVSHYKAQPIFKTKLAFSAIPPNVACRFISVDPPIVSFRFAWLIIKQNDHHLDY